MGLRGYWWRARGREKAKVKFRFASCCSSDVCSFKGKGVGLKRVLRGGLEIQGHGEEKKQELVVKEDSVICSESLRNVHVITFS